LGTQQQQSSSVDSPVTTRLPVNSHLQRVVARGFDHLTWPQQEVLRAASVAGNNFAKVGKESKTEGVGKRRERERERRENPYRTMVSFVCVCSDS
jgi:hypothetical protein